MAHELDITADANGTRHASFVTANIPAWHRLGTVFDRVMTAEEALPAAHLNGWNLRKRPLQTTETTLSDDGVTTETLDVPGQYASIRTNPITGRPEVLGIVGEQYTHLQNEHVAEFTGALLDQSGGAFLDTAGALRGGRSVFFCAKMPQDLLVGGVDPINLFLGVINHHDGTGALTALVSPVRIVCANTQRAAEMSAQQMWTIRHTSNAMASLNEARRTLNMTWRFAEEFEREAERMIQTTLTEATFEEIVAGLFPVPEDEGKIAERNRVEKLDVIRGLYHDAETQDEIRGTRWAGYQAVAEWADHFAPKRGEDPAATRALAALTGVGADIKAAAFAEFRVPATAGA